MTIAAPTGPAHRLRRPRVEAVISQHGGALAQLRVDGHDVVAPHDPERPRPVFRGDVLVPWPNRVADGSWTWEGQELSLPTNEDRGHALHGLALDLPWLPVLVEDDRVVLRTRLLPTPGYPFALELKVGYQLEEHGLLWTLDARNVGDRRAPYGCGVHPYLVAGDGGVDAWELQLPAGRYLEVDHRLVPTQLRPTAGSPYDFQRAAPLSGLEVDHALTDVAPDEDGLGRAVLRGTRTVVLEWDPRLLPWVQVHTADRPEPQLHRSGLAVEPTSCPPDALRSGVDLVVLEPGQVHHAWWRLSSR